ncbi:tetratricopeptide repeat protein [Brevundimonas sp. 2R-24]|uniref:Tetratricopeptide repeat protein n=1 Tax=Peiella sedimenti TaxID=3061083 RepID=A0ABT8SMZ1_9CAUL|nr:tetratricopeptide repeat protein [Caulobacteraceae bacterium XZ-24]
MREEHSSDRRRNLPALGAAGAIAVVLAGALALASCDFEGSGDSRPFWVKADRVSAERCPRPASVTGAGMNDQEREIRHLRRLAFQGDFFAQLALAERYAAARETDRNLLDPIESSVWYAIALANDEGYAPINGEERRGMWGRRRAVSRYDDCRSGERRRAYEVLDRLLSRMTREEQEEVRDRVIYILSTQDAEGFRTLARLHDSLYAPFGEPVDNDEARRFLRRDRRAREDVHPVLNLFPRNDADAYLYNYLAVQTGDVGAYVLLRDFESSSRQRREAGAFVEAKARRWTPPFEFYPPEAPRSGVPHSDESRPRGDAWEYALQRMDQLPFVHVGRALRYLGVTETVAMRPTDLSKRQVETLEAMLGHEMVGRLSYLEQVRAIQLASERGSSEAQLALAVMYAEGIGVPADYARSYRWFSEAARQGSPEANFAMSTYFALGVAGVADQDKAQAVAYRLESALLGFRPSTARLQAILAQVSRAQSR